MKRKLIQILLPLILLFACLGFVACKAPEPLAAPENLRIENFTLVWDAVKHAEGYYVYIDGEEFYTTKCSYNVGLDEGETHLLEVMACRDKNIYSLCAKLSYTGKYVITPEPTKGLEFEFLANGTLSVSKLAVDENGVCVIPATYGDYKVTKFTSSTPSGSMSPSGGGATVHEACPKIKTLYLPHNLVNSTTVTALRNLPNLEEVAVGKDLENEESRYISAGNSVIDKKNNSLVIGTLNSVIPDFVTKIEKEAFAGRNLTEFTVPDQITQIGSGAFGGCTALKEFRLPKNFTAEKFDFLGGCSSLTEATVPKGVVNLDGAFAGWTLLKEVQIPDSVQSMDGTFRECTSLERCVVPQGVKALKGTFFRCTSLKEVVLLEGLEEINYLKGVFVSYPAFYRCEALSSIELPSTLKTVGEECFWGCKSLKSIKIPDGVTSLGKSVFRYCTSLTEVKLPASLTEISEYAFSECTSLKSIQIPDGVTSIGWYAFARCTALTSVTLPANLTQLIINAFEGCTALEFVDIPENASSGYLSSPHFAFLDCTSLKRVVLPKGPQMVNNMFRNAPLEEVYFRETKEEWESLGVTMPEHCENFLAAQWYFYSETAPTTDGNFWHYVDGVPTKWNV